MEVYLLILGDHLPDPHTGRSVPEGERLLAAAEQAVAAEAAGFAGVAIGEHHFSRYIVLAPELLLANIAARTSTLRLSTGVTLLAHRDPVLIAEQLATLDQLSGGRAELIVARGVSAETDTAFGIRPEDLRPCFDERLRLLLRLLTETDVTFRGRYRGALDGITTMPRPVQVPPALWVGSSSEVSADLAAELSLPLMLPSTLRDPASFAPIVERYRRGAGPAARLALPSHLFVAPDGDEARRRWLPYLSSYAAFAARWRGDGRPVDPEALLRGAAICGDPDEVVRRLDALTDLLGLDAHLVLMDAGGVPLPDVLDAIRLFGAEVLPRLRPAPGEDGRLARERGRR